MRKFIFDDCEPEYIPYKLSRDKKRKIENTLSDILDSVVEISGIEEVKPRGLGVLRVVGSRDLIIKIVMKEDLGYEIDDNGDEGLDDGNRVILY